MNSTGLNTGQARAVNVDVILPPQQNPNGPGNHGYTHIDPNFDGAILNSEIYQIYCQAEDALQARMLISGHKNVVYYGSPKGRFWPGTEKNFKRIYETTIKKLWKEESGETKFERVKKFIDGTIKDEVLGHRLQGESMQATLNRYFTKIQVINPNGYEYFYVMNFKMGHHNRRFETPPHNVSSEWYRAVSYESGRAQRLAQLRVMGITDSILDQLQLDHYLTKNSTNMKWSDLAHRVINGDCLKNQDWPREEGLFAYPLYGREGMFYLWIKFWDEKSA